jgi:hypothetical protein
MNFHVLHGMSALYRAQLLREADHERLLALLRVAQPPLRVRMAAALRSAAARIDAPEPCRLSKAPA